MKQYSSNHGLTFADQMRAFTSQRRPGEQANYQEVTITRKKTTQTGTSSSWTLTCLAVNVPGGPGTMDREGNVNVANVNAYEFVFPRGTDINSVTDTINWHGSNFELLAVT